MHYNSLQRYEKYAKKQKKEAAISVAASLFMIGMNISS